MSPANFVQLGQCAVTVALFQALLREGVVALAVSQSIESTLTPSTLPYLYHGDMFCGL